MPLMDSTSQEKLKNVIPNQFMNEKKFIVALIAQYEFNTML